MKREREMIVALAVCILFCVPVFAHHGSAAYDTTKTVVLKDVTVTKFVWANPHVLIMFDAKDDKGNVQHWSAEAGTPQTLTLSGWAKSSVQAGDVLTVYINQSKTGNLVGRLTKLVLADGTELKDSALGYRDDSAR